MNIKNVTVAGSGVLGYQIAFQTAFHGLKVVVYDINDEILEKFVENSCQNTKNYIIFNA